MTEPSDLELIARFSSGDPAEREQAFAILFRRHQRRAYEVAFRVLGDPGLAADAVQESFLAVYRKGSRFQARAQFSSWFYRVILNQCIDLRRREKRHRHRPLTGTGAGEEADHPLGVPAPGKGPEAWAQESERAARVREALLRLSPKLSEVVLLRYPLGQSYEEIGEILGLPPGTVKSRLNRAHAALREILGDWWTEQ